MDQNHSERQLMCKLLRCSLLQIAQSTLHCHFTAHFSPFSVFMLCTYWTCLFRNHNTRYAYEAWLVFYTVFFMFDHEMWFLLLGIHRSQESWGAWMINCCWDGGGSYSFWVQWSLSAVLIKEDLVSQGVQCKVLKAECEDRDSDFQCLHQCYSTEVSGALIYIHWTSGLWNIKLYAEQVVAS